MSKLNTGVQTIPSNELAKMMGKPHSKVLRIIERCKTEIIPGYDDYEEGVEFSGYFIESAYVDKRGRTRKCYECTRLGCELLVDRVSVCREQEKLFTQIYEERFNEDVGLTNFRKLNAQKFQDWVFDEVLPQIRKTGGYIDKGATQQQLKQLQQEINSLSIYTIKGDTINDVCSATGLRRKDIKEYLFDNEWVEECNEEISYDGRYIYIERGKEIHFTAKGLDKILKDLQPPKTKED